MATSPMYRGLWAVAAIAAAAAALALLAPPASAWTAGPDSCGYTGTDSTEVGGPVYDFVDITATGTPASGASMDDGSDVVALPFTFPFCGIPYTDVTVVSNGEVCLGTGPCDIYLYAPDPIPSPFNPSPAIFGYATDLFPPGCNTQWVNGPPPVPCVLWEVQGTAPDRVFVYMEKDVPLDQNCQWICTVWGDPVASFEVKLFEATGCAEVHFEKAVDSASTHQVASGIQESGVTGLQYLFGSSPGPSVATTAVRYCQTTIPPPSCAPAFQTALVGQAVNVFVANGNGPYTWSAPGGSPASGAGSTFGTSYAATGTHTITVTDSSTPPARADCIVDVPAPSCSPASQTVFSGAPASLAAGGGDGAYAWSAPGGSPPAGAGASFATTYAAPGTFTVTVSSVGQSADCTVLVSPAACGYTITNPAPYDFVDVMATGVSASASGAAADDDYETHPMNLGAGPPFDFEFCGVHYTDVSLSSNGYVCFVLANGCTNNGWLTRYWWASPLPHPREALAVIYAYGTDLLPPACTGGGPSCVKFAVQGTAPQRVFVYEFKDVPLWNFAGPAWPGLTFEIKLYEYSDCFEVQYQAVQDPSGNHAAVAGFQDAAGMAAWEYDFSPVYSGGWSRSLTAWKACPPPRFAAWPDEVAFNEDQPGQSFDVLANDINVAGGPLQVVGHTLPALGVLAGPVGGAFTYAPLPDASGVDSFEYTIEDANGNRSTATVTIRVNPVNDAPRLAAGPDVLFLPEQGTYAHPGWATGVAPGPAAAADEAEQAVWFDLVSNSNPALFDAPPSLRRTGSAGAAVPTDPPASGAFALLRIEPSGQSGTARLCFRAHDDGGTDTAWTVGLDPARSDTGIDAGPAICLDATADGAPVAYFEPNAAQAEPGQAVRFDSCPAAPPYCSHDPDGLLVAYLWEFGDGTVGDGPSPAHAFLRPGAYAVRLTVRDEAGATATFVRTVRVAWPDQAPVEDETGGAEAAPMADAGPDLAAAAGARVQLAGAERSGRRDVAFQWTQEAGPPVQLQGATSATPTFAAPAPAAGAPVQLLFALRVHAGAAASPPDFVAVTVSPPGRAPEVGAGGTQVATVGARVVLSASGADPDGDPLAYRWEQVQGPPVALDGASAPTATFTAPAEPATLAFRLTASDGALSTQDTAVVHVVPAEAAAPAPPPASPAEPDAPKAREVARAPDAGWAVLLGAVVLALVAALVAAGVVRSGKR